MKHSTTGDVIVYGLLAAALLTVLLLKLGFFVDPNNRPPSKEDMQRVYDAQESAQADALKDRHN